MASRPKFWPWPLPRSFGLGLKDLASASPRSCCLIMKSHIFRLKLCKIPEFLLFFPAIILNRMLLIIIWHFFHNYFWPWPWPQPPEIGHGLKVLASFNITEYTQQQHYMLREIVTVTESGTHSHNDDQLMASLYSGIHRLKSISDNKDTHVSIISMNEHDISTNKRRHYITLCSPTVQYRIIQ